MKIGSQLTTAAAFAFAVCTGPEELGAANWEWLAGAKGEDDRVVAALNEIHGLSPAAARVEADRIGAARSNLGSEPGRISAFLEAAARERSEEAGAAHKIYHELLAADGHDHTGLSALFRLLVAEVEELGPIGKKEADAKTESGGKEKDRDADKNEAASEIELGESPTLESLIRVTEPSGWFLIGDAWVFTDCRDAAARTLAEQYSTFLTYKFFLFLRSYSVFPEPYAYCFILLAVVFAVTIVFTPLQIKKLEALVKLRRVAPELGLLQSVYGHNKRRFREEQGKVFRREEIDLNPGCWLIVVQLIFFFWMCFAMRWYVPQLVLDGSRFLWVSDVTSFDPWLTAACCYIWFQLEGNDEETRARRGWRPGAAEGTGRVAVVLSVVVTFIASLASTPVYPLLFLAILTTTRQLWGRGLEIVKVRRG